MQAGKKRSRWSLPSLVLLLGLTASITASLGFWQLDRARQKQALAAQVEYGASQPPVQIDASLVSPPDPWQAVRVSGRWLPGASVLLDNRAWQGRPGYWVVGVLQVADGSGHLAVLRGWVERRFDGLPEWQTSTETVQLEGRALSHVPRLFQLAEDVPLAFNDQHVPVVQNVELADLEQATGLPMQAYVIQQTSALPDGLQRDWAPPVFDINKHRGYALQWFFFAGFALFALGVVVVRFIRSTRRD